MPDLPSRYDHEAAIVAVLLDEFEGFRLSGRRENAQASWAAFGVAIQDALSPLIADVVQDGAAGLAAEQKIEISAEEVGQRAGNYAADRAGRVAEGVVDSTVEALAGGESTDGVLDVNRAEQIAATETTAAITAGETIAAGIILATTNTELVPIWHTERDEKVCPVCRPLHGAGREVFGRVSPTGPPAHPNCRCWLDYEG